jgi:hypothetical protein
MRTVSGAQVAEPNSTLARSRWLMDYLRRQSPEPAGKAKAGHQYGLTNARNHKKRQIALCFVTGRISDDDGGFDQVIRWILGILIKAQL